ncbi:ATP synthase F1 subcomplex delta subunit [Microbacteriaceae bacterium MWH-Ta3]|nr:ATP synthase F1 subcomplex delta subunit [Microbacteriaceae bacterium MWH-Ta3]
MGSATRVAVESARAVLAGTKGVKHATGVAVLEAGRVIGDTTALRAALVNPVATAEAKQALIASVFASAEKTAVVLLQAVVAHRWSSAKDMLAGIEEIGIRAIASAAKSGTEAELFAFGRAIAANPELELALASKRGTASARAALASSVLGSASDATVQIVAHLVAQPRGRRPRVLISQAQAIVADQSGRGVATVTSAAALSAKQVDRIGAVLSARYGRDHHIDVIVDDALVGGLHINVGNDTIDASIRSRLTELSSKLAS